MIDSFIQKEKTLPGGNVLKRKALVSGAQDEAVLLPILSKPWRLEESLGKPFKGLIIVNPKNTSNVKPKTKKKLNHYNAKSSCVFR